MKSDVVFGIEKAVWPALLVDAAGKILHANPAAVKALGNEIGKGSTPLSKIWQAENELSPEKFLAQSEQSLAPASPIKLQGLDGVSRGFHAALLQVESEGQKCSLVQLMPVSTAGAGTG